ncbi:MAG: VCBS repeat-containing protein [Rhodothermales bacterium]
MTRSRLACLAVGLLLSSAANGQSQSVVVVGLPLMEYTSVSVADFDQDGRSDLVMSGELLNGTHVTRLYSFTERRVVPRPNTSDRIEAHYEQRPFISRPVFRGASAWLDFNQDGWMDLIVSGLSETEVTTNERRLLPFTDMYRNQSGSGLTIQNGISLPGVYDGRVATGDLDNDGFPEIVLSGRTNDGLEFAVFRNVETLDAQANPIRTVARSTDVFAPIQATSLDLVDVDGDGFKDIVAAGFTADSQPVLHAYRNINGQSFVPMTLDLDTGYFGSLVFGDLDRDGDVDVVTLAGTPSPGLLRGETRLFMNDGEGTFTEDSERLSRFRPVPGLFLGGGQMMDFDGDSDVDILLNGFVGLDNDEQQRMVILEQIDGQLLNILDARSVRNGSVLMMDYDGNGRMDLFQVGRSGDQLVMQLFE